MIQIVINVLIDIKETARNAIQNIIYKMEIVMLQIQIIVLIAIVWVVQVQ